MPPDSLPLIPSSDNLHSPTSNLHTNTTGFNVGEPVGISAKSHTFNGIRDVRRPSTWGTRTGTARRHRSPGVAWNDRLGRESFGNGRVLVVDYVSREHNQTGRRKVLAQEFNNLETLRRFWANVSLCNVVCSQLFRPL